MTHGDEFYLNHYLDKETFSSVKICDLFIDIETDIFNPMRFNLRLDFK